MYSQARCLLIDSLIHSSLYCRYRTRTNSSSRSRPYSQARCLPSTPRHTPALCSEWTHRVCPIGGLQHEEDRGKDCPASTGEKLLMLLLTGLLLSECPVLCLPTTSTTSLVPHPLALPLVIVTIAVGKTTQTDLEPSFVFCSQ